MAKMSDYSTKELRGMLRATVEDVGSESQGAVLLQRELDRRGEDNSCNLAVVLALFDAMSFAYDKQERGPVVTVALGPILFVFLNGGQLCGAFDTSGNEPRSLQYK